MLQSQEQNQTTPLQIGIVVRKPSHECSVCGKALSSISNLMRHERIHYGDKAFKCIICRRSFIRKKDLEAHLEIHTGLKPFSCELCPAKFSQKGGLRIHLQTIHSKITEKSFQCSQCACVFKKLATLNCHVRRVHSSIVDNNMEDTRMANTILLNEEDEVEKKPSPDQQIINADEDDNTKCVTVLSKSGRDGTMQEYVLRYRMEGDVRWFNCNHCAKRFKKPSKLIRHFMVHSNEEKLKSMDTEEDKPYSCHICGRRFVLKTTIKSHLRTHDKSNLNIHMMSMHTGKEQKQQHQQCDSEEQEQKMQTQDFCNENLIPLHDDTSDNINEIDKFHNNSDDIKIEDNDEWMASIKTEPEAIDEYFGWDDIKPSIVKIEDDSNNRFISEDEYTETVDNKMEVIKTEKSDDTLLLESSLN